jgi:hypothetical protein
MNKKYLFLFLLLVMSTTAQDFESDPEVKDISARVVDVNWEVLTNNYEWMNTNVTFINFNVSLELWNPYNTELISYGSSSCRWNNVAEATLEKYEYGYIGKMCTEDYGPRAYPSGLSSENEFLSMEIYNATLEEIPQGKYYFSGGHNSFFNQTDVFYGLNLTISEDGNFTKDFEPIRLGWGGVNRTTAQELDFIWVLILPTMLFTKYIKNQKKNQF